MIHSAAFRLPLLAIATFLLIAGCADDNADEPNQTDEEYFQAVGTGQDAATKDLFTTDAESMDDTDELKELIPTLNKGALSPITPIRFGRRIESVTRSLTRPVTRSGDTIVIANVVTTFTGRFVIQALSGPDTVVIQKPYTETLERNLRFERVARTRYPRLNWRLDAVSVVNGGTSGAAATITTVEVDSPNKTFTVTDPDTYFLQLDKWWIRLLPVLNNVPVTVRVTVQSPKTDAEIVTLHTLPGTFGLHHAPFTLASETQIGSTYTRVYEKSWTISGSIRKYAHIMVSATTRESLYDDALTNFSSATWGVPYKQSN